MHGARLDRRRLLGGSLASLASACGPGGKTEGANAPDQLSEDDLAGDEFVLRGGHVLTMDDELGYLPNADVHFKQGVIHQIGPDLKVPPSTREVDARRKIVMPGFVDTHSHLWLTQMRGLFGQDLDADYFSTVEELGRVYSASDMAIGTELGALECLNAGITTVCAYCDNVRSQDHATAALDALASTGIRYRFVYGPHDDMSPERPVDLQHVKQLLEANPASGPEALGSFAVGVRLPHADGDHVSIERARREISIARAMKLPISAHASGESGTLQLAFLIEDELLADDLLIVHATGARPEQLQQLDAAGVSVALTPISEQRVGYGLTRLSDYAPHLSRLSLGCDGNALSGAADMFAVMQTLHNVEVGARQQELAMLPHKALELATTGGAWALGLIRHIGSLVPGKRADILLLDTQDINTVWSRQGDPSALLVYSATPDNIDAVWVEGKPVKYGGRLLNLDEERLFQGAEKSIWDLRARAASKRTAVEPRDG